MNVVNCNIKYMRFKIKFWDLIFYGEIFKYVFGIFGDFGYFGVKCWDFVFEVFTENWIDKI